MGYVVKHGDAVVLTNCEQPPTCNLSILTDDKNLAETQALWTQIAAPGTYSSNNQLWKILPAPGSTKKIGDPVSCYDEIYLTVVDDAGVQRYLSVNKTANQYVMADKGPVDPNLATWTICVVTAIKHNSDGSVSFAGQAKAEFEYGDGSYIYLDNLQVKLQLYVPHQAVRNRRGNRAR